MNPEDTITLYQQGREAWNSWAREQLSKREKLERQGIPLDTWEENARVTFKSHVFETTAEFAGLIFPAAATFHLARCSSNANFVDAQFHGHATFARAEFIGYAEFAKTQFLGSSNFGMVVFRNGSTFSRAEFRGEANFFARRDYELRFSSFRGPRLLLAIPI